MKPTITNMGLLCRNRPTDKKKLKRIVLGLGLTNLAHSLAQQLRHREWDVQIASTAEEARRASVRKSVCAVVVPFEPNDPLATAKVVNAVPTKSRVILLASSATDQARQFADMIGVTFVSDTDDISAIVDAMIGQVPIAS